MRVAAVDVGSNSIHMVVAEVEADGRFHVLDRAKDMVRLGGRTHNQGLLSPEAIENGVRTLATFRTLADRLEVTRVQAVATSAVREAANGGDFIRRVRDEVGWRIKVIQGLEEARLIYLGVRHATDLTADTPAMIVDIGGGSVELILVENGEATWLDSLKLGVARLTDRFLQRDPPRAQDLEAMTTVIDRELEVAKRDLVSTRGKIVLNRVIGTSGTMLNLVGMASQRASDAGDGRSRNVAVDAAEFTKLRRLLCRSDRAERLKIKGLDSKRVDLIAAGSCVAERVLKTFGANTVTACTWALREGVLLDFIDRHQRGIEEIALYESPRVRSVMRLARHLGETSQHGAQVARLALRIYDQLQGDLSLRPPAREWLHYAAQLHDIGHHIAHKNHHRHAQYLITNGDLLGFEPYEIDLIAQVARYHRKSTPKDSDPEFAALAADLQQTVRALSAILRVADALDRSHFGVVRDVSLRRDGAGITFRLDSGENDAALEIWEAEQRSKPLRQLLGRDLAFELGSPVPVAGRKAAR
jgi:exopolyphosphatase/guanosine-5'-triphosphate,3'-diphosphate pyrophosphatase